MLVQWLKHVGANVIGTVSTDEKAAIAREAGADHIILYGKEDVAKQVRLLTDGRGAEVVFDGVGMATWETSLDSARRRGLIVSYGNADGPVGGINLGILAQKGSLYATRPTLFDYYHHAAERAAGSEGDQQALGPRGIAGRGLSLEVKPREPVFEQRHAGFETSRKNSR